MIRMMWLAAGLAVLIPARKLTAQRAVADTAARRTAMDRLAFMEGDWVGNAWASQGPGQRIDMQQAESIRRRIGGQVLLVEGLGRRLVAGQPGDTVFSALGTIDWLPERGYVLRSFTLNGQQGEFPLTVSDSGFSWGYQIPAGTIRFTMTLSAAGEWHEHGEFSRDGTEWVPSFDMRLHKR